MEIGQIVKKAIYWALPISALAAVGLVLQEAKQVEREANENINPSIPAAPAHVENIKVEYKGKRPEIRLNRTQSDAEKREMVKLLGTGAFTPERVQRLKELGVEEANIPQLRSFANSYMNNMHASPIRAFENAVITTPPGRDR